ncbi:hypothetical protein AW736_21280 [Termitidicoccus mucosus]|uniref:Uncharacterized protein n=1 Tax=Termitidicoccus mucosus TaxID=1184151 RepID=A0A178IDE9_9BACT|nr:hypothetical protein AW736_21280 [Opitutaceae bacterium TSB47]
MMRLASGKLPEKFTHRGYAHQSAPCLDLHQPHQTTLAKLDIYAAISTKDGQLRLIPNQPKIIRYHLFKPMPFHLRKQTQDKINRLIIGLHTIRPLLLNTA